MAALDLHYRRAARPASSLDPLGNRVGSALADLPVPFITGRDLDGRVGGALNYILISGLRIR